LVRALQIRPVKIIYKREGRVPVHPKTKKDKQ